MLQERRSRDLRGIHQAQKRAKPRARQWAQFIGWTILCLCLLAYAAQPGFSQTSENPPATTPAGPTPPVATEAPGPAAPLAPPYFPPTLLVPQITPLTSPAVISPQFQLDYDLQIPLFSELPFRKETIGRGYRFYCTLY